MVKGLQIFKEFFCEHTDKYVLIGGVACEIAFASYEADFRATRDLDVVLIVEALDKEFGDVFWKFIKEGRYRIKMSSQQKPQFYRFDKPENDGFPKMIELFARNEFLLKEVNGITPIYVDDDISSLSAILLDNDYYRLLLEGRTVVDGLSILRPEYVALYKIKAYLDLKRRKELGEKIDSKNIRKHKKDVLKIMAELFLEKVKDIPYSIQHDVQEFLESLADEPFDESLLMTYGLSNQDIIEQIRIIYL